ncbi:MAG: Mth938-like domain-containing protein [Thermoplasmatota archaeon]
MHIDGYSFGEIVVDGTTYTSDLIIFPDCIVPDWRRRRGHLLQPADLADVIAARPGHLVVGTGAYGRMTVSDETRELLDRENIPFEVLSTGEACRAFNRRGDAAAALHLTC